MIGPGRTERYMFSLTPQEKAMFVELARREGEPMVIIFRRLLRQAARQAGIGTVSPRPESARERGLWPPAGDQHAQAQIQDGQEVER